MKKLLFTLSVLCMASSANAVQLSLTADPTVPSAEISGYLDMDVLVLLDSYEGIDVELGPDAPDLSGEPPPTVEPFPSPYPPPWEELWLLYSSTSSVYPIVDGTYLIVTGVDGDTVVAWWFDEAAGGSGFIGEVTLVPEPMTIALIGLGGLFLLRRRR
ncbi:MAG: hypothetical protein AMJ75_05080 [Phycisphaerae bacterium SM1_79]|nr:MAG: hypothetical protein AMJ75_05080 [Phycisphaerae bacterium SM1_79]